MNGDRATTIRHLGDTFTALGMPPSALDADHLAADDAVIWAEVTTAFLARTGREEWQAMGYEPRIADRAVREYLAAVQAEASFADQRECA